MVGVILCGGKGSRLYPLTKGVNKHLLPVRGVPMVFHSIELLKRNGIKEICIVTGTEHLGNFIQTLGSGKDFGDVSFTYKIQDEANGIAGALALTEHFVGSNHMCVVLGDNIFPVDYKFPFIPIRYDTAHIVLNAQQYPERFGVANIVDGKIESIVEKPVNPPSKFAVTGLYFYGSKVFDYIENCVPSHRKELEITDVNNMFAKDGNLTYDVIDGFWSDAGTHESYEKVNSTLFD